MTDPKLTPPPELVQQWFDEANTKETMADVKESFANSAAQWGADQELEACLLLVGGGRRENLSQVIALRNARRPKPPSLKEQALRILVENGTTLDGRIELDPEDIPIIRQALEQLND
jgi:hypothetical protein